MGVNSIHSSPKDFIWCENTSNQTKFKCQIKTANIERCRVVTQLDLKGVKVVLTINGYANISLGDYIKVPFHDKLLSVKGTLPIYSEDLARKRCDFEEFKSSLEVALA